MLNKQLSIDKVPYLVVSHANIVHVKNSSNHFCITWDFFIIITSSDIKGTNQFFIHYFLSPYKVLTLPPASITLQGISSLAHLFNPRLHADFTKIVLNFIFPILLAVRLLY